jgi:hypothetical protein
VYLQNVEHGLRGQPLGTNPSPFVERPKHATGPKPTGSAHLLAAAPKL